MHPSEIEHQKQDIARHFDPILRAAGAKIVEAPFEVHEFLTVEFRGERIPIAYRHLGDRSGAPLEFFFSHFDEVRELEAKLAEYPAPFHSDIRVLVQSQFGERAGFNTAGMIEAYLADRVRASGRRVWT